MREGLLAYNELCATLLRIADRLETPVFQSSHRALAKAVGCSPARIPAFMARLEYQGLIIRSPFKNCYMIDVTPLIDQGGVAPTETAITPDRSPLIDQGQAMIDQGGCVAIEMAITPDRSGVIDHPMPNRAVAQQKGVNQRGAAARFHVRAMELTATAVAVVADSERGGAGGGAHPTAVLLAELGTAPGPGVLDRVLAARDWTPQQIRDRWEYDQRRIAASDGKLTEGVFWAALLAGQLAPPRRNGALPLDPQSYALRPGFVLGSQSPPGETEAESIRDHAARLLPAPTAATHRQYIRDWMFVQGRLGVGDSDEAALAALAAWRSAVRR